MARIWQTGFELNSTANDVDYTSTSSPKATISSIVVNGGNFAMRCFNPSTTVGSGGSGTYKFSAANNNGPFYSRAYFYFKKFPASNNQIFVYIDSGGLNRGGISITPTGTLIASIPPGVGATIGTSSALSLNTWYRLELYVFNNTVSGFQELDARLATGDGTAASFGSSTTIATANGVNQLFFGATQSSTDYEFFIDDVAINDTTGSNQTSFPGAGRIVHLQGTSAGDANAWLNTAAGAGDVNNFSLTNEVTPDDATTMVQSGVLNSADLYNIFDPTAIDSSATINLIAVGGRFRNNVADATTAFKLEIEKTASGTKSQSAAIIPNTTTWQTNAITAPHNYPLITYTDPDGAPWTQSTVNSAQIGVIDTAVNVNRIQVSTVWASVDYIPSGATSTSTSSTSTSISTSSTSSSISTSSTSSSRSTSSTSSSTSQSTSLSTSSTSSSISTSSTSSSTSLSTSSTSSSTSISTSSTSSSTSISTSSTSSSTSLSTSSTSSSTSRSTSSTSSSTSFSTSSTSQSTSLSTSSTSSSTSLSTSSTSSSTSLSSSTSSTSQSTSLSTSTSFSTSSTSVSSSTSATFPPDVRTKARFKQRRLR